MLPGSTGTAQHRLNPSGPCGCPSGRIPCRRVASVPATSRLDIGAFPEETIFDRDVSVKMRDGCTLYTDVFRPVDRRVPAIILWSPYGKGACENGPQNYNRLGPYRIGIPYQRLCGYETFEGLNPAEWVGRGYAVVDIDARGCQKSEGDIHFWGRQEAEDVYDTIEFLSKQPWCSGLALVGFIAFATISQEPLDSPTAYTHISHPKLVPLLSNQTDTT